MLLIMLMVIDRNGGLDQVDFASRLHNWMCSGFKEFGDLGKKIIDLVSNVFHIQL